MRVLHPPVREPNPPVTANLHRAAGNWAANRARAKQLVDWEPWRERARAVRADAVAQLPELLERLTERVEAAGGTVHRAATGEEANALIARLCAQRGVRTAVKGKSMTTEETGLNAALAAAGVQAIETDLGEWIVQELGDRPSHILAPAVHLNAGQVAELFARRAGRPFDAGDTQDLVGYARAELRDAFLRADAGITGVNMAVAETGTLVLVESEGNIRLSTSLPRVHIALMGVEKVVRDWAGAAHLMQILPLAAHGKMAAGSTSLITGPARDGDDGPQELHLVLLDDGRMTMRDGPLSEALQCIRCGACLYACPVYRQSGGHAYGAAYSGPIGAVVTPGLEDARGTSGELGWMSSLCGACTEACPVKIPLDEQLVTVRAMAHEREPRRAERALFATWGRLWSRPGGYRATAATSGRALAPAWRAVARAGAGADWVGRVPFPFAGWTAGRDIREPAAQPFHARWRTARGGRTGGGSSAARAPAPAAPPAGVEVVGTPAHGAAEHAPPGLAPPPTGRPLLGVDEAAAVDAPADVELFADLLRSYEGELHEVTNLEEARERARALIGDATVARWADPRLDGVAAREAPAAEAEVSLVVADVAVAVTGTVGLVHGPGRPRAAGLLPARQVVLLAREDLVQTVAAAIERCYAGAPPGNLVFVAGPSRTADIEQRSIRGVHAPRDVDVILYGA